MKKLVIIIILAFVFVSYFHRVYSNATDFRHKYQAELDLIQ